MTGSGAKGQKRAENLYCILDCIYVETTQTYASGILPPASCLASHRNRRYYVLDLLAWKGIHYWETEAEFRFFCAICSIDRIVSDRVGLRQKLEETTAALRSPANAYIFSPLPIGPAHKASIVSAAAVCLSICRLVK